MRIIDLGKIEYDDALVIQKRCLAERIKGDSPDTLIICEHNPVVTLGRIGGELDFTKKYFMSKKVPVIRSDRGGGITYHEPGQLLFYPVMFIKDYFRGVREYLDFIEISACTALGELGIRAYRRDNARGVWVNGRKIGFMGVSVKRWVTSHGLSLNVENDLEPFNFMNTCGEKGILVTSVKEELCVKPATQKIKDIFCRVITGGIETLRENKYSVDGAEVTV